MISPAVIASLVFGACGMLATVLLDNMLGSHLRAMADEVGMNRVIFVAVPGLFAMLFALMLYQNANRKIKRLGESISRGILIALLTWISFSVLAGGIWCSPKQFGQCFNGVLLWSAVLGGGPMLLAALVAGTLAGLIIIRPPRKQPTID